MLKDGARTLLAVLAVLASPFWGWVGPTASPRCCRVTRECGQQHRGTPWATVEAAYDKISANFAESRRFPWPFVVSWLSASDRETLLVAGCGDGRHVQTALELGFRQVFALDLSQGMIKAAQRRLGANGTKVVFLHGDTRNVPLPDASVQDVLSCALAERERERERQREQERKRHRAVARVSAP